MVQREKKEQRKYSYIIPPHEKEEEEEVHLHVQEVLHHQNLWHNLKTS